MYRLAHFNEHGTQHFLVAHSVNNTTAVATRWYEFRSQGLGNVNKLSLYSNWGRPRMMASTAGWARSPWTRWETSPLGIAVRVRP